jgi:hypothetical protein
MYRLPEELITTLRDASRVAGHLQGDPTPAGAVHQELEEDVRVVAVVDQQDRASRRDVVEEELHPLKHQLLGHPTMWRQGDTTARRPFRGVQGGGQELHAYEFMYKCKYMGHKYKETHTLPVKMRKGGSVSPVVEMADMRLMCSEKMDRTTLAGSLPTPMTLRRFLFSSDPLPCSCASSALQVCAGLYLAMTLLRRISHVSSLLLVEA